MEAIVGSLGRVGSRGCVFLPGPSLALGIVVAEGPGYGVRPPWRGFRFHHHPGARLPCHFGARLDTEASRQAGIGQREAVHACRTQRRFPATPINVRVRAPFSVCTSQFLYHLTCKRDLFSKAHLPDSFRPPHPHRRTRAKTHRLKSESTQRRGVLTSHTISLLPFVWQRAKESMSHCVLAKRLRGHFLIPHPSREKSSVIPFIKGRRDDVSRELPFPSICSSVRPPF